jgi:hypothetical protein
MKTKESCTPVQSARRTVPGTLRAFVSLFVRTCSFFFLSEGILDGQVLVLITSQCMGRIPKRTNRRSKETSVNILFVPFSYPLSTSFSALRMEAEIPSENLITFSNIILSRVYMTIDGVWVGDSSYWSFIHSRLVITLDRSLTQTSALSLLKFSLAVSLQRILTEDL